MLATSNLQLPCYVRVSILYRLKPKKKSVSSAIPYFKVFSHLRNKHLSIAVVF